MTDYIDQLHDALQAAAVREYGQPQRTTWLRSSNRSSRSVANQRKPVLAAGISLMAAAVASVVLLLLGATTTTQPAYALAQHPNGSVTVTVYNLQRAMKPLDARLAALGVRLRIIPITKGCSIVGPVTHIPASQLTNLPYTFTARKTPGRQPHNDWGFIAIGHSNSGQLLYAQGAMTLPLPPCFRNVPNQFTGQNVERLGNHDWLKP